MIVAKVADTSMAVLWSTKSVSQDVTIVAILFGDPDVYTKDEESYSAGTITNRPVHSFQAVAVEYATSKLYVSDTWNNTNTGLLTIIPDFTTVGTVEDEFFYAACLSPQVPLTRGISYHPAAKYSF